MSAADRTNGGLECSSCQRGTAAIPRTLPATGHVAAAVGPLRFIRKLWGKLAGPSSSLAG
jgi:hypothetical protein